MNLISKRDLLMLVVGFIGTAIDLYFFAEPAMMDQWILPGMFFVSIGLVAVLNKLALKIRNSIYKPVIVVPLVFLSYWLVMGVGLAIQGELDLAGLASMLVGWIISIPLVLSRVEIWVSGVLPLLIAYYSYPVISRKINQ